MMDLSITRKMLSNGVAHISLSGFLDAHTFEQLEKAFNDLFDEKVFKVIVDLSKLDYISSAGVGVFISAISNAQDNGGNVVLTNPVPNVREVFDLLGLSQIFPFAVDMKSALEALH